MGRLEQRVEQLERAAAEAAQHSDGTANAIAELKRRLDEIHDRLMNAPGGPPPPVDPELVRAALQAWADRGGAA